MHQVADHIDQAITDVVIGRAWEGEITCYNANGQLLNLDGKDLAFAVRDPVSGLRIVKSSPASGVVISDPPSDGSAVITLETTDTARMSERELLWEVFEVGTPASTRPLAAGPLYPRRMAY